MSCNNCFSGCVDITSDKCVKYTGLSIPELGIENGNPLNEVELAITDFLLTVIDGAGIIPSLESGILCTSINDYLVPGDITLPNLLSAIIQAACAAQTQLDALEAEVDALNSVYTTDCITVVNNTDTHEVVQAVIDKLCTMDDVIAQLLADLPNTYVALTDLGQLIDDHLAAGDSGLYCNKMVPYTAVEFWGDPAGKFDATGAGIGDWINIYLCNGNNGTPDKRGRATVCATNNIGGGAYSAAVDPALGNPSYSLYSIRGENNVALTSAAQLPPHSHTATPSLVLNDHFHYTVGSGGNKKTLTSAYPIKSDELDSENENYRLAGTDSAATIGKTSTTSITVASNTVSVAATGSSATHNNIQPVIACYYIIYIPA